jgi:DNA-binding response OmpR family regulator
MKNKSSARLKVLVVDDEPDLADIVVTELVHLGVEAASCNSVARAKKHLENGGFDLVVSDVRMPGETGLDLLHWIRKRGAARPRVILMTAFADLNLEEALDNGADAFFLKPFDFDAMVTVVEEVISGKSEAPFQANQTLEVLAPVPISQAQNFRPGRGGCFVAVESSSLRPGDLVSLKVNAPDATLACECLVRWCRRRAHDADRPAGIGMEYVTSATLNDVEGRPLPYPWENVVPFIPARLSSQ